MKPITLAIILIVLVLVTIWLLTITHSWLIIAVECFGAVGIGWLVIGVYLAVDVDDTKEI